jgi:hypothetical protein
MVFVECSDDFIKIASGVLSCSALFTLMKRGMRTLIEN